ncbi:Apm3p [Sugiyamaella lignohabitans]|uniref:Apm3p n=1 Tax=Sugiyamaella lignohabitans TaxID=796027 RepID=A0A167F7T4_9ASCO|nr:Apm3p [Sugiyamaella lignohabitans]ANB14922.1 Apm3p [Sugiyamaella lignohabitans]
MVFMLPCTSQMPVMVPFEFINRFAEVLEKYFTPPVVPMRIETNLDVVSLLLNEMLDDGYPYVTEPDALRDLVPNGGLLSKLLSGGNKTVPTQSTIPWRRSNVRHTNNELFVDIVETLYMVLPAKPSNSLSGRRVSEPIGSSALYSHSSQPNSAYYSTRPLVSRIEGTIFVTSNLSGIPEISLNLNTLNNHLGRPSFHPAVKIDKWVQSPGTLQFIPPDGKALIASYTLDNNRVGGKNEKNRAQGQGLVFAEFRTGLGIAKDEFEARVWTTMSREVKHVEGLSVNVICDGQRTKKNIKGLRITSGDFHFNDWGIGEWTFPGKTPLGWSASLRGALEREEVDDEEDESEENSKSNGVEDSIGDSFRDATGSSHKSKALDSNVASKESGSGIKPIFPTHLSITYTLTGNVPSGIKVNSLRILKSPGLGEGVKPFKGLRYTTNVGEYIVR